MLKWFKHLLLCTPNNIKKRRNQIMKKLSLIIALILLASLTSFAYEDNELMEIAEGGVDESTVLTQQITSTELTVKIIDNYGRAVIEITNHSDQAISTKGLYLSDYYRDLFKWKMPSVIIQAGGRLLVAGYSDENTEVLKRCRSNFEFENTDWVGLVDATGEVVAEWGEKPELIVFMVGAWGWSANDYGVFVYGLIEEAIKVVKNPLSCTIWFYSNVDVPLDWESRRMELALYGGFQTEFDPAVLLLPQTGSTPPLISPVVEGISGWFELNLFDNSVEVGSLLASLTFRSDDVSVVHPHEAIFYFSPPSHC
jgi:hypothetical protein